MKYMHERRAELGGYVPSRRTEVQPLEIPPLEVFKALLEGSGEREMSTTMAFVRFLNSLIRDKNIGKYVVPIVPDEARTFGMEGMFRQLGIYSSVGQLYTPVDADQVMYYREDKKGQILQEGINEAGAMSSWIAAATSYSNHGITMIPFYILLLHVRLPAGRRSGLGRRRHAGPWLSDGRHRRPHHPGGRGPAAPGRPQSPVGRRPFPTVVSYDPTFAYELAVIVHDGLRAHVSGAGERLLLHHGDERELSAAGACRRV